VTGGAGWVAGGGCVGLVGCGKGFGTCAAAEEASRHAMSSVPDSRVIERFYTPYETVIPQLHDFCRGQQDWLRRTIEALVQLESPTDDKPAVDRCGLELASRLREIGGRVSAITTATVGNHLRAEFGAGRRQVLLLGHFDTVWPVGQLARMPLTANGDALSGPGIFDMKAGISLGMLATRALLEVAPPRDCRVVMLWTTDEETGSGTSRGLVETEATRSEAVLVLEPALPGGAVKTSRKGCGEYEMVIRGVAAHAGVDPGKGVSAIRELARQVLAIETLQDLERGVSLNVGIIEGGTRPNVIAEEARAHIDARAPTRADAERLDAALRALTPHLTGATITLTGGFSRPPMERTEGVQRLYQLAQSVSTEMGVSIQEGSTGGGSDGNFCAALGVPTLDGLGAVGDGAHALHEHVVISALVPRATLIAGLLERLSREPSNP
jgi:glutamate carboxypeptidase